MPARTFLALFLFALILAPARVAFSAIAPWRQDELVKAADAIAIVDIHQRISPQIAGSVIGNGGTDVSVALTLYTSSTQEVLYGRISKEPLIIQFSTGCDLNPLEEGRYILFLKAEGHLFTPLATNFRINGETVFWYRKPYLADEPGPEFGQVRLKDALRDIRAIIRKYKKETRAMDSAAKR